jgi:predicted GTPase
LQTAERFSLEGEANQVTRVRYVTQEGNMNNKHDSMQLLFHLQTAERFSLEGGANQVTRVRYVTQASSRPPTVVAFVSGTQPFTEASTKFLGNALRQEFGFDGVPLRMNVRVRKAEKGQRAKPKEGRRWGNRPERPKRMFA